ncbi:MAG: LbtU family siderophore porin, partial [Legionellales bacterium]|nr:LbtU family siderophore porin [Legionellales bacterium]
MKLSKIVTLITLISCGSTFANTDMMFQEVMDRNANPYIAKGDHDNRIFWSAEMLGMIGLRTATTRDDTDKNPMGTDIVLPRANIYMDAVVNDWTMAHMALSFHDLIYALTRGGTSSNDKGTIGNFRQANTFDETTGNAYQTRSGIFSAFDGTSYRPYKIVDEAFVTIGNLHRHPAYFRMGLGRVPFGLYERNQVLINWTTLFTETQAMFAQFGFMDASGFFGAIYAFRGLPQLDDIRRKTNQVTGENDDEENLRDGFPHINNGGASIGYCMNHGHMGFKVVVDWMWNMLGGINIFRTMALGSYTNTETDDTNQNNQIGNTYSVYYKKIMGMHMGFKGHYNQFDFRGNFVMAMNKFNKNEAVLPEKQPMVWSLGTGVHFKMGYRPSRFGIGFQMTNNLKNAAITDDAAEIIG